MTIEKIAQRCSALITKYGTRDPFELAKQLGVKIMFVNDLKELKGVYRVIKRNRWIFINANLPEDMQRLVCAHELGHDQFHRHLAKGDGLMEFMFCDVQNTIEYEANVFAEKLIKKTR